MITKIDIERLNLQMMNTKLDKEILDSTSKNPSNWRGVFYKNWKDYRLIVPKQNPSLGWTINFSGPYAYLFLIVFLLIIIVYAFII